MDIEIWVRVVHYLGREGKNGPPTPIEKRRFYQIKSSHFGDIETVA